MNRFVFFLKEAKGNNQIGLRSFALDLFTNCVRLCSDNIAFNCSVTKGSD